MAQAQAPSAVLAELSAHLQVVDQDPAVELDTQLLEKCELFTSTPEYRNKTWTESSPLFIQIATLLSKLQQDPSSLIQFVRKLAEPYRFEDIKNVDFELGLDLQATPVHGLILSLLEKATASGSDAQSLANRPSVMSAVVRLWLCTSDTGVATQAELLLTGLLRASKNEPASASGDAPYQTYGAGPMWRRLFGDRDINSLYYHYTSLERLSSPPQPLLSRRDKTISQARLLHWLPTVGAMDWNTIATGYGLDVEREVGLSDSQGLLHYAASKMVDTADDMLMHMTLLNFFRELIVTVRTRPHLTYVSRHQVVAHTDQARPYDSSLSLDFLKEQGLHQQIIAFHTTESPGIEHTFLSPRTSQYISAYASTYPENFENSSEMQKIRDHVHQNLRKCEARDLDILASMPRATLTPRSSGGFSWDECILLDVPITRTNPDALKTLATVFHGPPRVCEAHLSQARMLKLLRRSSPSHKSKLSAPIPNVQKLKPSSPVSSLFSTTGNVLPCSPIL